MTVNIYRTSDFKNNCELFFILFYFLLTVSQLQYLAFFVKTHMGKVGGPMIIDSCHWLAVKVLRWCLQLSWPDIKGVFLYDERAAVTGHLFRNIWYHISSVGGRADVSFFFFLIFPLCRTTWHTWRTRHKDEQTLLCQRKKSITLPP